jgi:glycerol-3-phosphate dehydrogenase
LWGAQAGALTVAQAEAHVEAQEEAAYGTDAPLLKDIEGHDRWLVPGLSEAMVRFAARYEYARTVEDVLARRNRLLFLDAQEAARISPAVAAILLAETGVDPQLKAFEALAKTYQLGH